MISGPGTDLQVNARDAGTGIFIDQYQPLFR
jgi:hypothetical protein